MFLSILCLIVALWPGFHSDYLASSITALSKRLTMNARVFNHKHTKLPTTPAATGRGSLCCTGADFSLAQQPGASPLKFCNHATGNTCTVAGWTSIIMKILSGGGGVRRVKWASHPN